MPNKVELALQLIVVEPPEGVRLAMQRGRESLLAPGIAYANELVFEFSLVVADLEATPVRFTGEFAQGPAEARFVYVRSGTLAGQQDSPWTRRAKVPLAGISAEVVQVALESGRPLVARVAGRAKDGGPFFASVPLLTPFSAD
jgi:Family of unknown function (DUF5990)